MKEDINEIKRFVESNTAVMLYFYNDNCAPCVSLRPRVEKLVAEEFPEIKLKLINGELNPEITAEYGIFSNPTLLVFFEGSEFRRESKYISISQLYESIERPYGLLFCKK